MSSYYFYKNESHLYVYKKPHRPSPTEDDFLNEYFGQLHLRLDKVKPLLVNCTVAPLAEECLTAQNGSNATVSTLAYMDQWIQQLIHQHAYSLLVSLLLIVIFMAILIVTLRTIVQAIRKYKSQSSLTDGYYYISSLNSAIEYYETSSEV